MALGLDFAGDQRLTGGHIQIQDRWHYGTVMATTKLFSGGLLYTGSLMVIAERYMPTLYFCNDLDLCVELKVVALKASSSNTASTVYRVFKGAISKYGRPSQVRGDHGTENMMVATDMIYHRGLNRGSFIWGM
jgi:hypothetical protein